MIEGIKQDFPSYPSQGSYLDTATMGLQPDQSIEIMTEFIRSHPYSVRKSLHQWARNAETSYYQSKSYFANYFGVTDEELAFMPNADIGISMMLHSLLEQSESRPRIISSVYEHHSLLAALLHLKTQNRIELTLLETEQEPCVVEYLDTKIDDGDIVCFGHTTQILGLYRDIAQIGQLVREKGGTSLIDISRTAGQTTINLKEAEIDIAIAEGFTDLLGPPMSGLLYVDSHLIDELNNPFPSSGNVGRVTHDHAEQIQSINKFELGAPYIAGMLGLQSSMQYLESVGMSTIQTHRKEIMDYLIKGIQETEAITLVDPLLDTNHDNLHRGSIITITGDFHSHDMALFLDETFNVAVRSGLLCAHPAVTALTLEEVVQISTHIYTERADIDRLLYGLNQVIEIMG